MKRFIRNIALFLIPIILILALYSVSIIKSGELSTIENAAKGAISGEVQLFGLSYRDNTNCYKQLVTAQLAPELLVLGTSRSMQIRGDFFKDISFYNAGGAASNMSEFLFFFESLPKEALPKLAVLVLDQNFYMSEWIGDPDSFDYVVSPIYPISYIREMMLGYYKINPFTLCMADGSKLGISANMRGSGYRQDGSYNYGELLTNPDLNDDKDFVQTFAKISSGSSRFEHAEDIYPQSLQKTEELLQFCKENGMEVLAILPPYAPSVINKMRNSGEYGYIDKLPDTLGTMFAKYGYELQDYTLLKGSKDAQFIDGYHGADRVYASLVLDLASHSVLLSPYIDTKKVGALLTPTDNPLLLSE